jgi:hypothetical protein
MYTHLGKLRLKFGRLKKAFTAVDWYRDVYQRGKVLHNDHVVRNYPDGTTHYFSLHVQPFNWESEKGALIIVHEITQLIEADQEAQESQRILDALMRTFLKALRLPMHQMSIFAGLASLGSALPVEVRRNRRHPDGRSPGPLADLLP